MNDFNLAVIGCGGWGKNHVRTAYRTFGDKLRLVCDVNPQSLEIVRQINETIPFTTELNDVLNNDDINAVVVATPAETSLSTMCLTSSLARWSPVIPRIA